MIDRANILKIAMAFSLLLGCEKPNTNVPRDYFGRSQFDALESKTSLYSYGYICGFLKRYGEVSPMNSMGWWHYGPYTFSDNAGKLSIILNAPPRFFYPAFIKITADATASNQETTICLYFDHTKDKLCAAKNSDNLGLTCDISEADKLVARAMSCINKIYRSENPNIHGQFSTLAR